MKHAGSNAAASEQPTITVVTPSFNQARFLEDALRSVLDQGYPELEYIVLDGGSTDGSRTILERYSDRLTYWRSAPDEGQAAALREGFAMASGDILAWLNSDDLLAAGALQSVAETWQRHREEVIVVGACQLFDVNGRKRRHLATFQDALDTPQAMPLDGVLDLARHWFPGEYFYQPEVFFPRSAYDAVGGIDPSYYYMMDYDLWVRFALAGTPVVVIDETLAWFREHEAQKTSDQGPVRREAATVANHYLNQARLDERRRHQLRRLNNLARYGTVCRAFQLGHRIRHGHPR